MPFNWFGDPLKESSQQQPLSWKSSKKSSLEEKRRAFAEAMEVVTRPIVETVGSSLGGAYAYNELVSRKEGSDASCPFDQRELREQLFAKEGSLPFGTQFAALSSVFETITRDVHKRMPILSGSLPIDARKAIEVGVGRVLNGDGTALSHFGHLLSAKEPRRKSYALLAAATAAKLLEIRVRHSVVLISRTDCRDETAAANDKKGKRARRRFAAHLSVASELAVHELYCPMTNFCSLVVWLLEKVDDPDHLDLKVYKSYSERDAELRFSTVPKPSYKTNEKPKDLGDDIKNEPRTDSEDSSCDSASQDDADTVATKQPFWGHSSFEDFVEDDGPIFI